MLCGGRENDNKTPQNSEETDCDAPPFLILVLHLVVLWSRVACINVYHAQNTKQARRAMGDERTTHLYISKS